MAEQKYAEYKQKLASWARLFEDEYGRAPTDADGQQSSTWVALNEKARHYKKLMLQEGGGSGKGESFPKRDPTPTMSRAGDRSRSEVHRRPHKAQDAHSHRRERSTSASPMRSRGDERGHSRRAGGKSTRRQHHGSPETNRHRDDGHSMRRRHGGGGGGGGEETGSPTRGRRSGRSPSHRNGGRSGRSAPFDGAGESDEGDVLPPLPDASEAVRSQPEYAQLASRAKEAREKLRKWERAFERDAGAPPTAADKGASNTYASYKRKYKGCASAAASSLPLPAAAAAAAHASS